MATEHQKDGAENDDDADFDEGGPVLEVGAFARTPDVDASDDPNHHDRQDSLAEGGERNDFREVLRESAGQGSDGTAGDDQEQAPAIEKSRDAAEGVADKAVQAPGFAVCSGDISVTYGAEKR